MFTSWTVKRMDFKVLAQIIIFKIVMPTFDAYGDWFIVYQLLKGDSFVSGQKCSPYYDENHLYIGFIAMIFPTLSWIF